MLQFFPLIILLIAPLGVAAATEPIVISDATVANITNTQAIVSWRTNVPSTSAVTYDTSACPCSQGLSDAPGRLIYDHAIALTGLTADKDYYVQMTSADASGTLSASTTLTFHTRKDTTLPTVEVNSVSVEDVGSDHATVRWKTNIGTTGVGVEYGTTHCPCPENVQIDLGTPTNHHVEVGPLQPNTTYFLRPFSYHPKDSQNTMNYGAEQTITTTAGVSPTSGAVELMLLGPNGSEKWKQGERHLAVWKATPGFVNTLRFALIKTGTEERTILSTIFTEQRPKGATAITIPPTLSSGTYTLELADAANPDRRDTGDGTMTIGEIPKPIELTLPTNPPQSTLTFLPGGPVIKPPATSLPPATSPPPAAESPTQDVVAEEKRLVTTVDSKLAKKLSGSILLQVEARGEGWYVNPDDGKKYSLGRPADAFALMRRFGLGVTHAFIAEHTTYPGRLLGKILIDVERSGAAYYIFPKDKKAYSLGRPADAFALMRRFGLGITNTNLRKIDVGQ